MSGEGETGASIAEMIKVLIEDRKRQGEEIALHHQALQEERERREQESAEHMKAMQCQKELLSKLMGSPALRSEEDPSDTPVPRQGRSEPEVKLTKLTDQDDIEAYLTTFERMMIAYEVDKSRWAFKLAQQLTGKAQQAYAAMPIAESGKYDEVKEAILRRYEIDEEAYRYRFRSVKKEPEETNRELAVRLRDLCTKWTRACKTKEEVIELIIMEQLLNTMPPNVRIWVGERKPQTSVEAGQLADDYQQARRRAQDGSRQEPKKVPNLQRKCHTCSETGHLARDCPKQGNNSMRREQPRKQESDICCFNCHQKGHVSRNCPSNALFCGNRASSNGEALRKQGLVEGKRAKSILLDTGCSRTVVLEKFVPREKILEGEAVTICCAHGDTVLYPLAEVDIEVDGRRLTVEAAVSKTLPMDVLLGTDVPELAEMLGRNSVQESALVAVTRSRARQQRDERAEQLQKEKESGVCPTPLEVECQDKPRGLEEAQEEEEPEESPYPQESVDQEEHECLDEDQEVMENDPYTDDLESQEETNLEARDAFGSEFDDDLFPLTTGSGRAHLSRSQKCAAKHLYHLQQGGLQQQLDISSAELRELQGQDPSLEGARTIATEEGCSVSARYFMRDGLLYHHWQPKRSRPTESLEQLVVPKQLRKPILELAHQIPLAGHLGKEKTAKRILQRFYWPTVFRDVKLVQAARSHQSGRCIQPQ